MHSFYKYVNDAEALVSSQTLSGFNRELVKQANTDEAILRYHGVILRDDEYDRKIKSPAYYGAGVEFLAHNYFEFFGSEYNLTNLVSMDDWDNPQRDRGADHQACSQKKKKYDKRRIICQPGSPIRIQTKGTTNPTKEHMTNDGSRIMNFVGSSLAEGVTSGNAYQMRLILFTLGKGLHYRLNDNTFKIIEVVNFNNIKKKIDGNPFFWNHMRSNFGLPLLSITSPIDSEANAVKQEFEAETS